MIDQPPGVYTQEQVSKAASIAGAVLGGKRPSASEARTLAGSVLAAAQSTQLLKVGEIRHAGLSFRGARELSLARLDSWQKEQEALLPSGAVFSVYDRRDNGSVTRYLTVQNKAEASDV